MQGFWQGLRRRPERVLKPLLFIALLLPLAVLLADGLRGALGANPVERITHETGIWALRLLVATLAVTPLRRLSGQQWLARLRRMLGLFGFFYLCLHLSTYLWLDHFFDWSTVVEDVLERPYITVGMLAFVLLLPLAATSTDAMLRRLGGRRWQRLHRLAYLATLLGCLHFLWLVKADLTEPLIYAVITLGLLATRLPWRRRPWRRQGATARGSGHATRSRPGQPGAATD